MAASFQRFKCKLHFNGKESGVIMYSDITYSLMVEMLVNKFDLDANTQLRLSYRLSPSDTLMEIKDNNDVSLFVTCACGSTDGIINLYIDQPRENATAIGQTRIIPGSAGILQLAKLCKNTYIREGGPSSVMPNQEFVRKIVEDASEDDHFTRGPWLSAIGYLDAFGIMVVACLGDTKNFCIKGKLELVVAIIKSCTPNSLGELNVTLKDPSGTMSGTIHHEVLEEDKGYVKSIGVGAVLILKNVSVFTPKPHNHYLNITLKNIVEVYHKDIVYQ